MKEFVFPDELVITIQKKNLIDFEYNNSENCPIAKRLKALYKGCYILVGSNTISIYDHEDFASRKKLADYLIENKLDRDIYAIDQDKMEPKKLKGTLTKMT